MKAMYTSAPSRRGPPGRPITTILALALSAAVAGCGATSAGGAAGRDAAGQPWQEVAPAQAAPAAVVPPLPPAVPAAAAPMAVPARGAGPDPTPTQHPLSIAALRSQEYPGSDLVVEQTLAPGRNYSRQIVSYRSEGLKIYALLTVPRGQRPASGWPVVVFNHGFIPPAQYRTTERYVAYVDAFARSGYIVLRPDYRGHGSSEGSARGGYGSPDYVVDVLNAFTSIRRWPDADAARVGMWGHSMGGYITLRAMVATADIKAGVIWGGVVGSYTDMLFGWGRTPTSASPPPTPSPLPSGVSPQAVNWRNQLVREYGMPEENPGFWASISANTYVQDLSGPLQLHHGGADASVPLQMSQTLERQVRDAGGSVELYVYPGDDHDISRGLGQALAQSVAFFDRHVKNAAV